MAAENTEKQPKKYTFYLQFIHGSHTVEIPVKKTLEDIPERYRAEFLIHVGRSGEGNKIRWPFNPTDKEAEELERTTVCPQCGKLGLDLIWPMV